MSVAPSALRTAIFHSGLKQIRIARLADINETRFSKIVCGHVDPNAWEKKQIARVLRKTVDELFPFDPPVVDGENRATA